MTEDYLSNSAGTAAGTSDLKQIGGHRGSLAECIKNSLEYRG